MFRNYPLQQAVKHLPKTLELLKTSIPYINAAGFSRLMPRANIPEHTDDTGIIFGSLGYHLGLQVPMAENCCGFTVGGDTRYEKDGHDLIFDATNVHSAYNNSDEERTILYIDFKSGKQLDPELLRHLKDKNIIVSK